MNKRRKQILTVSIGLILLLAVGCSPGEIEEPEHHFAPHQPVDFQAAVARMQQVHHEILDGPLASRKVKSSRKQHHPEGEEDEYSTLDPLAEMTDLAGWLPEFAADSDLKEEPWNQVDDASKRLGEILTQASSQSGDNRRKAYLNSTEEVEKELRQLQKISNLLPDAEPLPGAEPAEQTEQRKMPHQQTQGAN